MTKWDVVVIGGGHAGAEAAFMAARLGATTALVTMQREAIGRMSCNPAIGGVGKGQMVREIDALGGLMGMAADRAGIQFRMLNKSKGPAVWAPRAQADRDLYPRAVQDLLAQNRNVHVVEGTVEQLITETDPDSGALRMCGVRMLDGRTLNARSVIITTGTFLRGLMHCGSDQHEGGRIDEAPSRGVSASLELLGFELGRLKTGTPPRIHRDSIDYNQCERQPGDREPIPFSFLTPAITQPQMDCWVTWTNESVHELIRGNLHRAPMYSGQIHSRGPRYCPSIEDKVVRFAEKNSHQIFLEPEGYDNERVYCNGISTSLPKEVQDAMIQNIPGLQSARILQHGYAVEYDFVPTHQTKPSLETKRVKGLFLAGQINGTSGYEEAAGQGIVAGINAARFLADMPPMILTRQAAYIGVMIDDLVTRPPTEPYRMFTSRAEYRLLLRADNADQRLTPLGRELGIVDDYRWRVYSEKIDAISRLRSFCARTAYDGAPLATWMRRPQVELATFVEVLHRLDDQRYHPAIAELVLLDAKYQGYVDRQALQIERLQKLESMPIPERMEYLSIAELRAEAREQLIRVNPGTLGQAARISGITPADVTVLWVYLSGRRSLPRNQSFGSSG